MHLLRKVSSAVERLSEVIQDVLNVSLIDADRLDLTREPVFLNSILQSVLTTLRNFGPTRRVAFHSDPASGKYLSLRGMLAAFTRPSTTSSAML